MHIERISTSTGLATLQPAWTALQQRCPNSSVFMSWDWLSLWWQHYGNGHELHVLVVRDGDAVLAIAPLYVQRRRVARLFAVRILRNLGTGGDTAPDDLDPLIDPEHPEATTALADHLLSDTGHHDLLRLADFDPQGAFAAALRERAAARGLSLQESVSATISYEPLPATWDAYMETLHRDRRNVVRRFRRKLEALPQARFFTWTDPATLDAGVDRLIELHLARWTDRSADHAFSTPQYVGFHRAVMHRALAQGWLRLFCIEAEGQVMAMLYCYRWRDRMCYFQGGFDPAQSKLRPGLILMGHAIEQAIVEGAGVYDMLRGQYDFKTQWARSTRQTGVFELSRRTLGATAWRLRTEVLPGWKRRLSGGATASAATAAAADAPAKTAATAEASED